MTGYDQYSLILFICPRKNQTRTYNGYHPNFSIKVHKRIMDYFAFAHFVFSVFFFFFLFICSLQEKKKTKPEISKWEEKHITIVKSNGLKEKCVYGGTIR